MKKIAAVLLTILMMISLAACGGEKELLEEKAPDTENTTEVAPAENTVPEAAPEQESDEGTHENTTENEQTDDEAESEPVNEAKSEAEEMKILVAYFSATNTTEGVAEKIADSLSADIYKIVPEPPYTDDDLNYHDNSTRATVEQNDKTVRPAITGSVEDMEQYNIVFIGFPIWRGDSPRIISTFMESYDFSGKTIVPFCTSGSSGIGSSATDLEALTDGATWLPGTRLDGDSTDEEIVDWVDGLGLDLPGSC